MSVLDKDKIDGLAYDKSEEALTKYLEDGKYADRLKACTEIGVGFVDGEIEVIYSR